MMAGASSGDTSSLATRSMVSRNNPFRRRRSKGTIAGFAHGKSADSNPSPASAASDVNVNGDSGSSENVVGTVGPVSSNAQGGANQPQHTSDGVTSNPTKPCHSARLALLCCQNAIRMGARTQLGLCPPGRARRGLQAALRQRTRSHQSSSRRMLLSNFDTGGYYGLEKMVGMQSLENNEDEEEDYLLSTNTYDVESDEEASSGDDDELSNIDDLLSAEPSTRDYEKKYLMLREPLFTPAGAESMSNPNGAPSVAAMGGAGTNKLPFNRRKIRYFDSITAFDRAAARSYLQQELARCKQRAALMVTSRIKRMQREERRRRRLGKGEIPESDASDSENEDLDGKVLSGGVSQFDKPMTASIAASLIIESLSLNPLESVEGMAKCYDGIVAAGVALLDTQINDPTSPSGEEEKPRPSRSEIMAALAPLLITSLEQPSGELIIMLAKLRQMCGTFRYQRRFVQRIVPCLVRPPRAAMWCLKHQNDMEPLIAAAELIFDSAPEVFSKGWYERGQLLLADSKRAETLNTAAMQLRNLSAEPSEGLSLGLHHAHGHRRNMFMATHGQGKDSSKSSSDLAEWEVIAVDRQIRISISNIMSSDWSRVVLLSKDDISRSYHQRRSIGSASRRPSVLPTPSSGDASPRSLSSPRSPTRLVVGVQRPLSPPSAPHGIPVSSQVENLDNAFAVTLPSQPTLSGGSEQRPLSPDAIASSQPPTIPLSPTLPHRTSIEDFDSQTPMSQQSIATPPRSPRSPARDVVDSTQTSTAHSVPVTPNSPRRNRNIPSTIDSADHNENAPLPFTPSLVPHSSAAPLSPSSLGTSVSASELVAYRSSSSSVVSSISGTSQTAHYRTLTSTASERKRTVAACRALRAQITRFEEAFFQLHGRPPKGAAERAPLATTYSQYREWKRAIRADAACRIQALFRGAGTRNILLRSNDSKVRAVVRKRSGVFSHHPNVPSLPGQAQENAVVQLDIEGENGGGAVLHPNLPSSGVDVYMSQEANQPFAPQWGGTQIVRPRRPSAELQTSPASVRPPSNPGSEPPNLSLSDLQARKRELKQQLKQYDMNFARRHGRMPVKAEKEPIRHLYETYNALKSQISMLEQDSRHAHSPTVQQSQPQPHTQQQQPPPSNVHSRPTATLPENTAADDTTLRRGNRNRRSPPPNSSNSNASANSAQDLSALRAEKGQLHQMLRSYERDFFREHRRQVSSFADIRPVASQYRRYKEIKRAIAALQQGEN